MRERAIKLLIVRLSLSVGGWQYKLAIFAFNKLFDLAIVPAFNVISDAVVSKIEYEKIKKEVQELQDAQTLPDVIDAVDNLS